MLNVTFHKHTLDFKRPAGTSRGTLNSRDIWIIAVSDPKRPGITGTGECGPLPKLSIDDVPDFEARLEKACEQWMDTGHIEACDLSALPSVRFGFETAWQDLQQGGRRILFENAFTKDNAGIPINGLVWMNDRDTMYKEALEKVEQGFNCIKFKVGALDFDEECRLLESIRKLFNPFKLEIRVDANGAFKPGEALQQLKELNRFSLHSIEQPIRQGQREHMQELCAKSPLPIALDEELIGVDVQAEGEKMLSFIKPAYIILKPSLLGGFRFTDGWIQLAGKKDMGWWITSALESNIGLNAIAQFTANYKISMPQGLGTGSLYTNNFPGPLEVSGGKLYHRNLPI